MNSFDEPDATLDLAHLASQTGGDRALQRDLLDLFILQAAEFRARIGHLEDPAGAGDLVHRIKGSARAIGAFGLSAAAEDFECALSAHRPLALVSMTTALTKALSAIEAHLQSLP